MAKFNVNTGVGQFSPGQAAAIDKIVRQTPPVDDTVVETPVEQLDLSDPLVADLTQTMVTFRSSLRYPQRSSVLNLKVPSPLTSYKN